MAGELPHGHGLKGRYKILSTLGEGGFSSVYLARDLEWRGNMVALKAISTEGYSEEEYLQLNAQFLQEAAFLMTLDHPGLPKVVEFFAEGLSYYLALEWIAGKNTQEVLRERGHLGLGDVIGWGLQLCDILEYLHTRQPYPVLLGDLKPSNVILRYDEKVSVIDFGVARQVTPGQRRRISLVSPGFSSPEMYQRHSVDTKGDIYSLGATLYWWLTGADLARYKFQLPPLRRLRPDAHPELDRILARCLEVEPLVRYRGVPDVGRELRRLQKRVERERKGPNAGTILSELYKAKKREL